MELVDQSNPVLRQKAQAVTEFSESLNKLVNELFLKLSTLEGVGLAAPQIGSSVAVAVIEYQRKDSDQDDKIIRDIPRTILINPRITWASKDTDVQKEACFSLPKQEVEVSRFKKIHVEYQDLTGKKAKLKAKGFFARVIQHEIDHLNGILICDFK